MAKKGRPLSRRELGSGAKLNLWLNLAGKRPSWISKDNRTVRAEDRDALPSSPTVRRWIDEDLPEDQLPTVASVTTVPLQYWRATESLENFKVYAQDHLSSTRPPPPVVPLLSNVKAALRTAFAANGHVREALRAICRSLEPISVDQISDQLGVSIIHVRDIVEMLEATGVVVVRANAKTGVGGPSLVELAFVLQRYEIEALINGE